MGKTLSCYLPDELIDAVKTRCEREKDSVSNTIAKLLEHWLAGSQPAPQAVSPTIITDLMRILCGELDAREYTKILGDIPQPQYLRSLLAADLQAIQLIHTISQRDAKGTEVALEQYTERARLVGTHLLHLLARSNGGSVAALQQIACHFLLLEHQAALEATPEPAAPTPLPVKKQA